MAFHVTATIVTIGDKDGALPSRDVAVRGKTDRKARHLVNFMAKHHWVVQDIVCYQQKTFTDSLKYHRG